MASKKNSQQRTPAECTTQSQRQQQNQKRNRRKKYSTRARCTANSKRRKWQADATQGRKGCKAIRINMAFSPEIHEYIKVMAPGKESVLNLLITFFGRAWKKTQNFMKRQRRIQMMEAATDGTQAHYQRNPLDDGSDRQLICPRAAKWNFQNRQS